uniref:doublecortin domain-containing protein 2-like isoform X1 n=1 Tax=Monopterus albus TaxID=43700 RepID=UPI0009B33F2A|nr:doublecortin domain-containing protein 2-like isoform X1 [Monopterus albus]XP_020446450.1 doublecortin domain-containing protein 2-like isoform X1 [Monopterus albus]
MQKHTAKPERAKQQRQVSRNPVLLATGEGSVFNAQNKRSEMAGSVEVQEDCQLKVDLPIDQLEAKIVDEQCEDRTCSASLCKASLYVSDDFFLQKSLFAGPRKDETKEREVSSSCDTIRSLVSRFVKEK